MRLKTERSRLMEVGWFHKGWSIDTLVAGILHVDDAMIASRVFGCCCLQRVAKVWPEDVGFSVEEEGPTMRFLNAFIHVDKYDIYIAPFNPNLKFAVGITKCQQVARLGLFLGPHIQSRSVLRGFMLSQLIAFDYIVGGSVNNSMLMLGTFIHEIYILKWPANWIAWVCKSLPGRFDSPYARAVRRVGRFISKHGIDSLFGITELDELLMQDSVSRKFFEYALGPDWCKKFCIYLEPNLSLSHLM